jgi:hypothetical protein
MVYVVDHARHERSRPVPQADIVYLTAVLSQMNDPLYEQALREVRDRHPCAAIHSAKTLWDNRESWLASREAVLWGVTHAYIIPNPDRSVGQGIVLELDYFKKLNPAPKLAGIFGRKFKFEAISGLKVFDNPTPTRFALLESKLCAIPKPRWRSN